MFRFAEIGRVWVPVDLPLGEEDDAPRIWLLQTLYTRKELQEREKRVIQRTATGLLAADGAGVRSVEDLERVFDETIAVEDADLDELLQRTHDWRDVTGDDGQATAFSHERLRALLDYQWFARVARQALFTASREGVRKNSRPGPGGSPGRLQA